MKTLILAPALLLAFAISSCSSDIENLAELDPASKEYKQELAKLMEERGDKLTYTFNKYVQVDGKDYMDITIDGRGGLHANSLVQVNDWSKLEGIKRTKGIGYSGAELKNLKVSITNPDTRPTLVFRDLDRIID